MSSEELQGSFAPEPNTDTESVEQSAIALQGVLPRRAVIVAAAWSVPVIVLATASPALAASVNDTLAFGAPSYTGAGCVPITGVIAQLRTGVGGPVVGETVTVTIGNGYTFATTPTPTTSTALVTDGSGDVVLPAINPPATGGAATITASVVTPAGPLTATATISATPVIVTARLHQNSTATASATYAGIPSDATPFGVGYFLLSDGDFRGTGATTPGVTSADALRARGANWAATIDGSGVHRIYSNGAVSSTSAALPALIGARAVGIKYALTPAGALYWHNASNVMQLLTTGITSADSINNSAVNGNDAGAITTANTMIQFREGTQVAGFSRTVAPGSVAVGLNYWLSGSELRYQGAVAAGLLLRSDVVSAVAESRTDGNWVGIVTSEASPQHRGYNSGDVSAQGQYAVPAGSTAVGLSYALSPAGDLYSPAGPFLTGIAKASGATDTTNNWVTVIPTAVC